MKTPKNFTLIAGPCSVESEAQVLETALALKPLNISLLRGGVWKPRTRPNSFEGIGEPALKWLKAAGNAINVPVTTEVANTKHVEAALKNNIDVLWIGARTTVNPFYVQEIAEALKGVNIPVMIKNPINPDLTLWIGAIERLKNVGVNKVFAIHRGFSTHKKTIYRNEPKWETAIELKIKMPDVPIICDPSHIAGQRTTIFEIAQKSIDLEMDGLMIETHIAPDKALSDAQQQLTPNALQALLSKLNFRNKNTLNTTSQLDVLRRKIDALDEEIFDLLKQRFDLVSEIGKYKKEHQITILQLKRWEYILKSRLKWAEEMGLNDTFVKKLLADLHDESISLQTKILNDNDK